jgi:hypothetical protein
MPILFQILLVGYVAYLGFWWGNLRDGNYSEDLGIEGRIILEWILNKLVGTASAGLIWHRWR